MCLYITHLQFQNKSNTYLFDLFIVSIEVFVNSLYLNVLMTPVSTTLFKRPNSCFDKW